MKTQMQDLSTLFDGELEIAAARRIVKAVARDAELRDAWQAYVLIGEQLRREDSAATDLTAAVMTKLRDEPVILAPGNGVRPETQRQHPLWALAASVAGVAVVGWLALSSDAPSSTMEYRMAAVPVAPTSVMATATVAPATPPRSDMREYLLAHQIQAATFRLGDSTEHVRTVTLAGSSNRP